MNNSYTNVYKDIWVCNDCDANSDSIKTIKHYISCVKGESKSWEKTYEKFNKEE